MSCYKEVDFAHKIGYRGKFPWGIENNIFKAFTYDQSSINRENFVKIRLVDVEIIGLTDITKLCEKITKHQQKISRPRLRFAQSGRANKSDDDDRIIQMNRWSRIWDREYSNWPIMGSIRPGRSLDIYDCHVLIVILIKFRPTELILFISQCSWLAEKSSVRSTEL